MRKEEGTRKDFGFDSLGWEHGSYPDSFASPLESLGTRVNPTIPIPRIALPHPVQFPLLSAKLEMVSSGPLCVTCCDLLMTEPKGLLCC